MAGASVESNLMGNVSFHKIDFDICQLEYFLDW